MPWTDRIKVKRSYRTQTTLTADDWDLYGEDEFAAADAAADLNATFDRAVLFGGDTAAVRKAMYQVMAKHSSQGANDSEPHQRLQDLIELVFGKP